MKTLVDCGCETKVYKDGSGVEIYYCPVHDAAPEMLVALSKLLCPECNHELQHHADPHGCEVERGDGYRGGEILEALGPCGCNDDDLSDDYPDLVRAIAAIRKARGK